MALSQSRAPRSRHVGSTFVGRPLVHAILLLSLSGALRSAADPAGFPFLRLGSNARTSALGEAGTALLDDQAFATNPAALSPSSPRVFGVTHSEWIQQIRHEYVNAAWRRPTAAVGVAVLVSHADELERRVQPSAEPLGTFGVYEWAAGLTANRALSPQLRGGATVKVVRQSIFTRP